MSAALAEDRTITMAEFITSHRIYFSSKQVDDNPNMDAASRDNMDHWRCTFRIFKRRMTVPFSMGSGHHGRAPTAGDVLDALASDSSEWATGVVTFEDWCANFGYDTDSRE